MSALTSLLARDQVVAVRKIEEALQKQVMSGGDIASVLLELDAIAENTLAAYSAALYGRLPATRDEIMRAPRDVVRVVPREVAEKHRLVAVAIDGNTLVCALAVPLSPELEQQLSFLLGHGLVCRVACEVRIAAALSHHYGIEPTPRMRRLIERLRERDAGPVPYVAPPETGKLQPGALGAVTKKKSAASFLDDDDSDAPEPAPAPPSQLRPSGLPPSEGRTTDPLGVSRASLDLPASPSEPPKVKTTPPPRRVSVPPPASVRPPEPEAPRAAVVPPEPALDPELKSAALSSARAFRRLRGPLPPSQAAQHLDAAQSRDEVLDVFFAFARQFFDYAALFAIHDDKAELKDAHGRGTTVPSDVPAIALGPAGGPRGLLGDARARLAPVVSALSARPEDRELARLLGQASGGTAIAVPVAMRGRAVLLLLGVREGESFAVSDVPELVAFVPRVVSAIERIILKKKKGASFSKSTPRSEERSDLKAAVRMARESAAPRARARSADRWAAAGGEADKWDGPAAPPPAAPVPRVVLPTTAHHPATEVMDRRSLADAILSATDAADPPAAMSSPASAPEPRGLLGIPRSAPPPPDSGFVVPVVTLPPRNSLARTTLPLGPVAEPEPRNTLPSPPPASEDDEPELSFQEGDGSEDDEPELTLGEGGDTDGDEHDDDADGDGDADGDDDGEGRSTLPTPAPQSVSSVPPAVLIAPHSVSSSYSMRDLDEEVVIPLKRSRSRSEPAGEPDPEPEPADASSEGEKVRDPRREDDGQLTADRVPMRAVERAVEHPPSSTTTPSRHSHPAAPPSRDVPSVIVDMGDAVENLVVDLQHAGPDDERAAVNALLRMGEAALPVLAQTFPGPLWFDRNRPHRRAPRGRDVCAIARAFYAFGVRATPYVASLVGSSQVDRRYYALLLAGDMVHPSLLDAVLARLFDENDAVRKLAHEIAPRFRGLSGWDEQMTVVRRAARIRGKDPKKRIHALTAIAALRDAGALRMLVELLEDDDRDVVRHAHGALVALTAEDLGPSPRKWSAWADKNAERHRVEWLIDALTHADEALRSAAGDELKTLTQQYFGFHPSTTRREREVAQEKYRKWWQTEGKKLHG